MVFPHSSPGYRDDRGRGQAKAFKTPSPTGGFLAPGVPVEVAPPPPPPPTYAPMAPAAGGAAAGVGGLAFGTVAAIAGGAYLGVEVKRDIDKFKKNAKKPFYDTDAWHQSKVWDGTVPYSWDEYYADLEFQMKTQEVIDEYLKGHSQLDGFWSYSKNSDTPDGWVNPVWANYFQCPESCEGDFVYRGTLAGGEPACVVALDCATNLGHTLITPATSPAAAVAEFPACQRIGVHTPAIANPPDDYITYGIYIKTGVGTGTWTQAHEAVLLETDTAADTYTRGWGQGVAPVGTQPSLAEQLAGQKLPGGSPRLGYYVQIPINYPFMLVDLAPGSPPVGVPDVVIDPAPGTVTIVPPSPPEYPSPEAGPYEGKTRNPFPGFINVATEAQDFLEAMHKGLPKKHRSKGRWGVVPDGDIILLDIINHWDEWDAQVALEAFVNNQIEDHLLGKYYFGKLPNRSARQVGGRVVGKIPLPEVHFANGQHSISVGDVEIELVPGR